MHSKPPRSRISYKSCGLLLASLIMMILTRPIVCLSMEVSIQPVERRNNYFGGRECGFSYQIVSDINFDGRITWRLNAENRTILRGENPVQFRTQDSHAVELKVLLPPVKSGVVQPLDLELEIYSDQRNGPIGHCSRKILVFHENPFQYKPGAVRAYNLYLFDPMKMTAQVFQSIGLKYHPVQRLTDMGRLRNTLLVIGEGLAITKYRGLVNVLKETASSGNQVVCLSLNDGTIPLVQWDRQAATINSAMIFRGKEVIALLDKRLDIEFWPPDGHIIKSRIQLQAQPGGIAGQIRQQGQGWPWVEIDFVKPYGKLLFCGFNIIGKWDTGPAPRYLLDRIFQYASEDRISRHMDDVP